MWVSAHILAIIPHAPYFCSTIILRGRVVYETFHVYVPVIPNMYGCVHPRSFSIITHLFDLDLDEIKNIIIHYHMNTMRCMKRNTTRSHSKSIYVIIAFLLIKCTVSFTDMCIEKKCIYLNKYVKIFLFLHLL